MDFTQDIKLIIEQFEKEQTFIHSKIDKWLEAIQKSDYPPARKDQKMKEIVDLGKFIFSFDQNIEIIDGDSEKPDFIVRSGEQLIGIEFSDLVIQPVEKQSEGAVKKLLKEVEEFLKTSGTQYHGLYTIVLSDAWRLSRENLAILRDDVIQMIIGSKTQSDLIAQVRKQLYGDVHVFSARAYMTGPLTRQVVEDRIKDKNSKLVEYSKSVQETWLVFTISGVKASDNPSFVEQDVFTPPFYTDFKKVFILNFFRSKIYALTVQPQVPT
jgi:hypothetical protein